MEELQQNVLDFVNKERVAFNKFCEAYEAWQISLFSIVFFVVLSFVYDLLFQERPILQRIKLSVFRFLRKIPMFRNYVKNQLKKPMQELEHSIFKEAPKTSAKSILPQAGMPAGELVAFLKNEYLPCGDFEQRRKSGKVSGTIYVGGKRYEDLTDMLTKVYGMFAWTNPLHAKVFPGIRQMEAEVISMACNLFGGDDETVGSMTSGGTESIVIAMKAYRDWARDVKGITEPNIVAPRTGHPALDKACQYFNINLRKIQEDPVTRRADVAAMRRAIDSNTIALFGSCPQYPHGVVDPISELSALAVKYNIGLHVDCCLGSFLVCFMRKAGFEFPDFDFSLPGVTTISADTHKFGYAPKGSSVVMYRNAALRRYAYSVFPDWPGGIYGTPTIAGSRPGALVAATWASLVHHGQEGYIANTKAICTIARTIAKEIAAIDGIKVVGSTDVCVVAWTSDKFDINRSVPLMGSQRGWDLNVLQFPSCIHLCVTMAHTEPGVVEAFLRDMREVTAELMKDPNVKPTGEAAMYGTSQAVPDRSIVVDVVHGFLDVAYQTHAKHELEAKKTK